jgi:hypothetical protein
MTISRRRGTMGGGFGPESWPALVFASRSWSFFIGQFCSQSPEELCCNMPLRKI